MQTHSWQAALGFFLTALALGAGWSAGGVLMTYALHLLQQAGSKIAGKRGT